MIEINERSQGRFCQNHVKEHRALRLKKKWRPIDLIVAADLVYKKSETRNPENESWIDIAYRIVNNLSCQTCKYFLENNMIALEV